jgi:hypothetical protein
VRGFLNVEEWIKRYAPEDPRWQVLNLFLDPESIEGIFFSSERYDGGYADKILVSFKEDPQNRLVKSYLSQNAITPELVHHVPDFFEFFLLSPVEFLKDFTNAEEMERIKEEFEIEKIVRTLEFLLEAGGIELKRDILDPLGESSLYGEGRKASGIFIFKIDEPERFRETVLKMGRIGKLFGKADIMERGDSTLVVINSKEAPNRRRAIALMGNIGLFGRREKVFKVIDSIEREENIFSRKEFLALWDRIQSEASGYIYTSAPYALRSIFPEGSETCHPCLELRALAADIGPHLDDTVGTVSIEGNSILVDLVNPVPYVPLYVFYKMASSYDLLKQESLIRFSRGGSQ